MCWIVLFMVEMNVPVWVIFRLIIFHDSIKIIGYLTALLAVIASINPLVCLFGILE